MLIKIEDLKKGDEIIIAGNDLKYLRILKKPEIDKSAPDILQPVYKHVRCTAKKIEKTENWINWQGKVQTNVKKEFECTEFEHNVIVYQNLNKKQIWLVKRAI